MAAAQGPAGHESPLDPSGRLRSVVSDCVHCGFCLPSCPTYQLWGEEMDSPRGRIYLIKQILDGTKGTEAAATHLDRCLGCMACVTACPSGVRYDRLIEAARGWAEEVPSAPTNGGAAEMARVLPPRSRRERAIRAAIFGTFPYPRRLRAAIAPLRAAQRTGLEALIERSGLADRLSPELGSALRLAPRARPAGRFSRARPGAPQRSRPRLPERIPAMGQRRATVGMLTGCVQRVFFPQVNAATARVLAAEGCDVIIPAGQGCCGALSLHGGRRAEASRFARQAIETFERAGVDAIVVNVAGCGSAMKEYRDLLADDPAWSERAAALSGRVRDLSEFLAELGPAATRHPLDVTVAYHPACHLAHAQRITAQPRELLAAIPGLRLAEIADAGTCCGSAGIYNLVQPGPARELGRRKAANVAATGAELLVTANPGCAMQIASSLATTGNPMPMAHIAEVLDASIRGAPVATLLA
ncbi:MAG TPA: heterodisulfide reductase-related iron-sulfur binding cluster [Streptosporangiaceae bacterium]|nr:heterodisulfide reductase-related iron-sulfur binding cluster [Streptosporangiaceae bacterium]